MYFVTYAAMSNKLYGQKLHTFWVRPIFFLNLDCVKEMTFCKPVHYTTLHYTTFYDSTLYTVYTLFCTDLLQVIFLRSQKYLHKILHIVMRSNCKKKKKHIRFNKNFVNLCQKYEKVLGLQVLR